MHILLNSKMQYLITHYWEMMIKAWPKIIEVFHVFSTQYSSYNKLQQFTFTIPKESYKTSLQ